jgi:hypothetical protein
MMRPSDGGYVGGASSKGERQKVGVVVARTTATGRRGAKGCEVRSFCVLLLLTVTMDYGGEI